MECFAAKMISSMLVLFKKSVKLGPCIGCLNVDPIKKTAYNALNTKWEVLTHAENLHYLSAI